MIKRLKLLTLDFRSTSSLHFILISVLHFYVLFSLQRPQTALLTNVKTAVRVSRITTYSLVRVPQVGVVHGVK